MNFYHDLVTEKSWQLLQYLAKNYRFILIGGWAVFLYSGALKSKDIDLIMEYRALEKLREEFEVFKNERLKKYEARSGEVEIDIYVPFWSNPGIGAEDLKKYVTSTGGFKVPTAEVLAMLKMKALSQRSASPKGKKDLIDILSLFKLPEFDFSKLQLVIAKYSQKELLEITKKIIRQTVSVSELGLNTHKMARFKKQILSKIK